MEAHCSMTRHEETRMTRRTVLASGAAAGLAAAAGMVLPAGAQERIMRAVPSSGKRIPAIGMGSWLTFDVGRNPNKRARRVEVLRAFFAAGGGLIDSSPMYGTSEEVIGHCLKELDYPQTLFSATKVWTISRRLGVRQMEVSRKLWGLEAFDLMQIHNMLDWQTHLPTLQEMKAAGKIRHIGITTSHGRRHDDFAQAMAKEPFDFVQFTYNIENRQAEERLLPLARERGHAVIINRPFERGRLFRRVRGQPLPGWAAEIGCTAWSQVFLKFIISHPAVTCAIPATSRIDHMRENMAAGAGALPDQALRQRMADYFDEL
jgi:aryl-alcohol dehydrogenase-like predicted oxidoreductase